MEGKIIFVLICLFVILILFVVKRLFKLIVLGLLLLGVFAVGSTSFFERIEGLVPGLEEAKGFFSSPLRKYLPKPPDWFGLESGEKTKTPRM